MEKVILIGDKEVKLKATAGTMTRYRMYFRRDFLKDLFSLQAKLKEVENSDVVTQFNVMDLEMFERIAWVMAKTADNSIPSIEFWLDDFEMFTITQILPEILGLVNDNMLQQTESKKKLVEVANH